MGGRAGVWGRGREVSENLGLGVGEAAAHERAKGGDAKTIPASPANISNQLGPDHDPWKVPREEPSGGLGESGKVAFMWALCPGPGPAGTCHAEVRGLRKERPF